MRIFAIFFHGLIVLIAAGLLSYTFVEAPEMYEGHESFLYPQVILSAGIFFGCISFYQSIKTHFKLADNQSAATLILSIIAMCFLCLALVPIGFLPVSIIFFILYSYILGYRKHRIVIPSAIGVCVLLWLIFEKFLEIPLPMGLLADI